MHGAQFLACGIFHLSSKDESMSRSARIRRHQARRNSFRSNTFELLERRDMLSGSPPTVTKVEVASTSWSQAYVQFLQQSNLGTNGYSIPRGSSAQAASLTWNNIDQIMITFNEDVIISTGDLSLSGKNHAAYAFSDFHYDPILHLAKWTLAAPLDKDRLRLDLDTDGTDPVRDLDENILDGEWTNNVSTVSGNGTVGGDFQFNFNVLPTDVNNTGNINNLDYSYIRQLDGKTTTSTGYIANRDINGDGVINSTDWQEALNRSLQTLPSGVPAGTNNDAPTSRSVIFVQITDTGADFLVSLPSYFNDAESGGSGLTYSIISDDNSSLFDTSSINQSTKCLVLNAANNASGRANLVVRATDPGGLSVDTVITVDVNYVNQAPQILHYDCQNAGGNTWIISGDVVDPDDNVADFIVTFYGVYDIRSAVDDNGHFEFAIILQDGQYGFEYAVTYDPHGLVSNTPFREIGTLT
jgi:hypothetical protein